MWTFSRKYSSEVLCTIIYQTCDGDYRRYISSIDEKCTKDGNVEGEKRAKEFALKKEVMRSFLKEDNIPLYCKILMEYGNMCNNVLANNMGDFFKSLQSIELSMEKKDVLGKEEYTEDYMIDKWESIIYYILVGEGVMLYAVLKQVEEDNIEKKNLKSENYTVEDIKRICHSYNMENQNQGKDIMLTEKFYKGIEICGKFDRRIQVGKRKADEERDGHFKVSFPSKLEEILKEICWRGGNVNNKNNENKKLYIYDTLNVVMEELKNEVKPNEKSLRKIIYDFNKDDYYFSYEIFERDKIERLFSKKKTVKDVSDSSLDFELVEDWNYYTGQLIINCIWQVLTDNKANDFFQLAANSGIDKEMREKFDNALYWSIEEIINLTPYFSYVETAYIAERLYSCVWMFAEKIEEDFSIAINIFTSLALALQEMEIVDMHRFWKTCAECNMNNEIKNDVKRELKEHIYYSEFFVRKHSKIDIGKLGGTRSKKRILYNKIGKAVLFSLYKKRLD